MKSNKTTTCKHCGAVGSHFSFQCQTQRKPIKSKGTPIGNYTMESIKPHTATKTKPEDMSMPQLKKLATIVFNRFIRNRDAVGSQFQCISCGEWQHIDVADCGHYRQGTISELKFNEDNCSSECRNCNRHDDKHLIGYRINLIEKIGLEKVLWLESFTQSAEFKVDKQYYLDIIKKYK